MTDQKLSARPAGRDWFGHPPGLTILFLTEAWEKFSFYGMRAILMYYMVSDLRFPQPRASLVYGLYTAFVYLTPLVGGVVADRWLGRRKSVLIGGSVMAIGHFLMTQEALFFPALATIALGNGLFLPSLPSQIEALYRDDDPRRTHAYSIYYVGINLGSLLAPLLCGTVGELFGWHWGFGLAGIGMILGLIIYSFGQHALPPDIRLARERPREALPKAMPRMSPQLILVLAGVWLTVVLFRGAYEQQGNTLALWAENNIDRHVAGGLSAPMTWFQMINPAVVFLLTPFVVARWSRLAKRGRETSALMKMCFGAIVVGLSYAALAAVASAGGHAVHWVWLAAFLILLTVGELYILPVGLALFGRAAPAGRRATAIAAWFSAAFAGNLFAGWLGAFWTPLGPAGFFVVMAGVCLLAAGLLALLGRAARFR